MVKADSAPLIPPFTYNNQCGSVVLTSYIPVFLLGYSIQLLLPFVRLALLAYMPYGSLPRSVREVLHGVVFPEYWRQGGDVSVANRASVNSDPLVLFDTRTIFCNDVFNNWLVMLTFGLCSPVLAVAIACSVLLKMYLWTFLLGRFTKIILEQDTIDADDPSVTTTVTGTAATATAQSPLQPSQPLTGATTSVACAENKDEEDVNFALGALAETHIPLFEVLAGSFWQVVWCSALFVALLGWDMATDEVGWLWVLLVPLGYVLVLRCVAYFIGKYGREQEQDQEQEQKKSVELQSDDNNVAVVAAAAAVSRSPLHIEQL